MVIVNTEVLEEISNNLTTSANKISSATSSISSFVKSAGSALSGAYYSLTVEETRAVEMVADGAVDNLRKISNHLDMLQNYAEAYLNCRY